MRRSSWSTATAGPKRLVTATNSTAPRRLGAASPPSPGRGMSYRLRVISSTGRAWATGGSRCAAGGWRRRAGGGVRRRWRRVRPAERGAVDDRLVHRRPEVLGGLELARIGRQEDQADPVGDGQVLGSMPARIVGREDDAALAAGAGLAREEGEQFGEEGLRETAAATPERLAAGRLHEGGEVQPPAAVVAEGDRSPADGRPDPASDRLQAQAGRTQCVQPSAAQTSTGRSGCAASASATAASSPP